MSESSEGLWSAVVRVFVSDVKRVLVHIFPFAVLLFFIGGITVGEGTIWYTAVEYSMALSGVLIIVTLIYLYTKSVVNRARKESEDDG